jgi:hypothetical protein
VQACERLTRALQEGIERDGDWARKLLAHGLLKVRPNLGRRIIATASGSVWRELVQHVRWMKNLLSDFYHAIGILTPQAVILFVSSASPIEEMLVGIETICFHSVARG